MHIDKTCDNIDVTVENHPTCLNRKISEKNHIIILLQKENEIQKYLN